MGKIILIKCIEKSFWSISLVKVLDSEHDLCYQLTFYPLTCNQNQLLSASSAIQTFAIKLIYYQLSCDHIHLLSSLICYPASTAIDTFTFKPQLLSSLICYQASFAIKPHLLCSLNFYRHIYFQASLANRPTCHQSSVTINNFAFNHHLPKDFQLDLNPYFQQFFPQTSAKKIETFLKILSSSFSGKLSWALGMEPIYC